MKQEDEIEREDECKSDLSEDFLPLQYDVARLSVDAKGTEKLDVFLLSVHDFVVFILPTKSFAPN